MSGYLGFDSVFAKVYKRVGNDYQEIKVKVTSLHYVYSEENTDASRIQLKSDEASVVDNPDLQEFKTIFVQFGSVNMPSPKRELLILDSQLDGQAEGIILTLSCFPRAVLLRMASNSLPIKDTLSKCGISVVKQKDLRSEDAEPIEIPEETIENVIYIDSTNPSTEPSFSMTPGGLFKVSSVKNPDLQYKPVTKTAYDAPDVTTDFELVFKGDPDKDKVLGQSAWETLQNHIGNGNIVDEEARIGSEPNYITASDDKITVSNKDYDQSPSYDFHYKDEPGDIISFQFETGYREHLSKSNQKTSSVDLEGNLETTSVDTGNSSLAEHKPTEPNLYQEHQELFKMLNLADPEQFAQYKVWQDIFGDNPNLQYTIAYSEDAAIGNQNLKLVFFPDPVFHKGDAGVFGGKEEYEMVDPSTGEVTTMKVPDDESEKLEFASKIAAAAKQAIATKLEGYHYDDPQMSAAAAKIAKIYGVQNYLTHVEMADYSDYEYQYEHQDPKDPTIIEKLEEDWFNPETGKLNKKVTFRRTQKTDFRNQNIDSEDVTKMQAESTRVYDPQIGGKVFVFEKMNPPSVVIDPTNSGEESGVDEQNEQDTKKEERELYKGTVKIVGGILTPHVISGKVCTLYGVSEKWGGNWFINSATHSIDFSGGYVITLKLERDATGTVSEGLGSNENPDVNKEKGKDGVEIPEHNEGDQPKTPVLLTVSQYQTIIDVYTYWSKTAWKLNYQGMMGSEAILVPWVTSETGREYVKDLYSKFEQADQARGSKYSDSDIKRLKSMPNKRSLPQDEYFNRAYALFASTTRPDLKFDKEYYHNSFLNTKQKEVQDITGKMTILFGDLRDYPDGDGGLLGNVESGVVYDSDGYFREFKFTYGTHKGDLDLIESKLRLNGELLSWILQYLSKWSVFYRKEMNEYLKYQVVYMRWLESLGLADASDGAGVKMSMYNIVKVFECGDSVALYNKIKENNWVVDPSMFTVPKPILKSFAQPLKDGSILGEVGWGHSVTKKSNRPIDVQYGLQNADTKEPVIGVTITADQAQSLFNADLSDAQLIWKAPSKGLGSSFNNLSINRQVALTSLSYNSGATYRKEVVQLVKAEKWEELKDKWSTSFIRTSQAGTEKGIRNRRAVEALLLTQE